MPTEPFQLVPDEGPTDAQYREWARAEYASTDIEIDDDARTSRSHYGAFVQAWVWVYAPESEED